MKRIKIKNKQPPPRVSKWIRSKATTSTFLILHLGRSVAFSFFGVISTGFCVIGVQNRISTNIRVLITHAPAHTHTHARTTSAECQCGGSIVYLNEWKLMVAVLRLPPPNRDKSNKVGRQMRNPHWSETTAKPFLAVLLNLYKKRIAVVVAGLIMRFIWVLRRGLWVWVPYGCACVCVCVRRMNRVCMCLRTCRRTKRGLSNLHFTIWFAFKRILVDGASFISLCSNDIIWRRRRSTKNKNRAARASQHTFHYFDIDRISKPHIV